MRTTYLIALGSNQCHSRFGPPARVLEAALDRLAVPPSKRSPIIQTSPLGPSLRRYANAAAIIESDSSPPELLAHLKRIERSFGRKKRGQRWIARVLDLDIILWSGGIWADHSLAIPHPAFRKRHFVLTPAALIAPDWHDPVTRLSVRQCKARLDRKRALP